MNELAPVPKRCPLSSRHLWIRIYLETVFPEALIIVKRGSTSSDYKIRVATITRLHSFNPPESNAISSLGQNSADCQYLKSNAAFGSCIRRVAIFVTSESGIMSLTKTARTIPFVPFIHCPSYLVLFIFLMP